MIVAILAIVIAFWCYRGYVAAREKENPRWICKECGYAGPMTTITMGSFAIELFLWLCFLVPGLLYSLWRSSSRRKGCPKCKSTSVVPTDSPIGGRN